jgi:hypothetical protein
MMAASYLLKLAIKAAFRVSTENQQTRRSSNLAQANRNKIITELSQTFLFDIAEVSQRAFNISKP